MADQQNGFSKSFAMSPSVTELTAALIAVQKELPKLKKDKENPFFKSSYVGLDTVLPAALEALSAHGLGLLQTIGGDGNGGTTLSTTLLHESGEWVSDTQPLMLVKPDPQSQGSAITYARRYAVMAILGLVADDDDDGNAASPPAKRRAAPSQKPQGRALPPSTADAYGSSDHTPAQPERADGAFVMKLTRDGECLHCSQPISKGTNAFYSGKQGAVWHERCDSLPAAEKQRKLEPALPEHPND